MTGSLRGTFDEGVDGFGGGKLLLFGEHVALYGRPAVGISLPNGIRVVLRSAHPGPAEERTAIRPKGVPDRLAAEVTGVLDEAVLAVAELSGIVARLGQVEAELTADLPLAAGFGSSAALCVASVRALFRSAGFYPEPDLIWRIAHRLERRFHGRPSGIDTGLSVLGGCRAFRPKRLGLPDAEELEPPTFRLVVGAFPRTGSTKTLVATIGSRIAGGDDVTARRVDELGDIAESAIESLRARGHRERETSTMKAEEREIDGASAPTDLTRLLGALADRAHERLASLGLSTPSLDRALDAGRRAGAAGGKLSGAGGGGAFFLVSTGGDRETVALAEAVRAAFPEAERRGDMRAGGGISASPVHVEPLKWNGVRADIIGGGR